MPSINWGGDETTAPFTSELDEASGNLVLAEDNNGNTVLLEWDGTTWQYRGPIEMNGEDVSGVGTLTATDVVADSVSTGGAKIGFVRERIETVTASGSGTVSLSLDFSSLGEGSYFISVESDVNFRGRVTATTNFGGTGDYYWFDEAGTKQPSADNWELLDISAATRGHFGLQIRHLARTSFDLSREINRNLSGYAVCGGTTESGSLDTLTIEFANASSDTYEATLYRRVQL